MTAKVLKMKDFTGPPRKLNKHGTALWKSITAEYNIEDSAGIELLCQACEALDRAANLREAIDRDGEIIRTKTGPRDHPGLKHELVHRAFIVRTLARLGLDAEPLKAIGRPGTVVGWRPQDADE
jgi:hypothetical protein